MKNFFKRNGSTILTGIGAVGVIATAVMTAKATPKAVRLLDETKKEKGEDLTKFEVIKSAAPAYIPAALVGASTIACIFGANVLNKRKQAALISAYALLDSSYKEYKNKVKEMVGEDGEQEITNEIAKDKFVKDDILVEDDKQLFYDEYSGRYFNSTMEQVIRAEYTINKFLSETYYVCLNEFYEHLNIPKIDGGDDIGWSQTEMFETYWESWLDFHHEKVEMEDGLECYIIRMSVPPSSEFMEY